MADSAVPVTGGAAILARLRAQKAASAAAAKAAPVRKVVFAYASQTGTAAEVARNLYAEAVERKLQAEIVSLNDLGVDALTPTTTPYLVIVAASTGDGDPPDNASAGFLSLRRQQGSRLKGMRFTVLGLGDSNYTRFMYVSRTIKNKLLELGAEPFYPPAEADEVDGLENVIDPWVEGIWGPLEAAMAGKATAAVPAAAPAAAAAVSAPAAVATPAAIPVAASAAAPAAAAVAAAPAAAAASPAAASAPAPAPASAAPSAPSAAEATSSSPTATNGLDGQPRRELSSVAVRPEQEYGLVGGRAPAEADLKGAPAAAPCRTRVVWEEDADAAAAVVLQESSRPSTSDLQYRDPQGQYSTDKPFWATISDARVETASWSDRRVLHLQFDVAGSGMAYEAGDALGVAPLNPPALVQDLIKHLGLEGGRVFRVAPVDEAAAAGKAPLLHLPSPCSVQHAFSLCLDITGTPKKSLLRVLAEHCSDEAEKRTLIFYTSKAGRDAYAHDIVAHQPSLLDLLRTFPSCRPPLEVLLEALPPLMPRLYSVTNSGSVHPNTPEVALSVVRFNTRYGTRCGVASTWLDLCTRHLAAKEEANGAVHAALRVALHFRRAADFKPPKDLSKPVIMIGPGTGVAPFRGFLQHRHATLKAQGLAPGAEGVGASWLYFGCRRRDEDFLYESDLRAYETDGTLTRLRTAFSREAEQKVYVQHLLREDAQELAPLIQAGAYVFVCGDGAAMVKDVHAALLSVLVQGGGMSEEGAAATLAAMVQDRRYIRDVWS